MGTTQQQCGVRTGACKWVRAGALTTCLPTTHIPTSTNLKHARKKPRHTDSTLPLPSPRPLPSLTPHTSYLPHTSSLPHTNPADKLSRICPQTQSKSLGAPHNGTSLTQAHAMPAGFEPRTSESAADHLSARQSGGQGQQARGQSPSVLLAPGLTRQ